MQLSDFDYDLPPAFIAQTPVEPRDASRLLVLERAGSTLQHARFHEIGSFLQPGDALVLNQTRVIPARLFARKLPTGGRVELLLLKREEPGLWQALVGGKSLRVGRRLALESGPQAEIVAELDGALRKVQFADSLDEYLTRAGHIPLPPYIHTHLEDPERYQTVFAQEPGSAAAPTAGLHFTPALLKSLQGHGIQLFRVTLHIGLDTFAPVKVADPAQHKIHREWCQLEPETAHSLNRVRADGGRIVAVGTTVVRTLETAAQHASPGQTLAPFVGQTQLFILPGYKFRAVDALLTNFHLPRSTLLMLVSAFAGREKILHAYEAAKTAGYRFFSFGDAMFIY